jgi:endonuclease III
VSFQVVPDEPDTRTTPARVNRSPVKRFAALRGSAAAEHRDWQTRVASRLLTEHVDGAEAKRTVSDLASTLLALTGLLHRQYASPDLGNKADPVDELVYIILSRRTREGAYQPAFAALRAKYETWEEVADATADEIERVIGFSGLGRRKAQSLKLALGALIERFGRCTLEPTRAWHDDEVRAFLCTLPEIGPKSAACVMMCSLDRPAFPVDAHVGRVLERLDIFRRVGIDLLGRDHKIKQRLLWDAVPPSLRYPLHVNMLVHGRMVCLPQTPRCGRCVISPFCEYAAALGRVTTPDL